MTIEVTLFTCNIHMELISYVVCSSLFTLHFSLSGTGVLRGWCHFIVEICWMNDNNLFLNRIHTDSYRRRNTRDGIPTLIDYVFTWRISFMIQEMHLQHIVFFTLVRGVDLKLIQIDSAIYIPNWKICGKEQSTSSFYRHLLFQIVLRLRIWMFCNFWTFFLPQVEEGSGGTRY